MALGLTQPLTEMSTRNISWGVKADGAYGWKPYHLQVPIVLKSGSLNLLGPSRPVQASNGIALPFKLHLCMSAWYFLFVFYDCTVWRWRHIVQERRSSSCTNCTPSEACPSVPRLSKTLAHHTASCQPSTVPVREPLSRSLGTVKRRFAHPKLIVSPA